MALEGVDCSLSCNLFCNFFLVGLVLLLKSWVIRIWKFFFLKKKKEKWSWWWAFLSLSQSYIGRDVRLASENCLTIFNHSKQMPRSIISCRWMLSITNFELVLSFNFCLLLKFLSSFPARIRFVNVIENCMSSLFSPETPFISWFWFSSFCNYSPATPCISSNFPNESPDSYTSAFGKMDAARLFGGGEQRYLNGKLQTSLVLIFSFFNCFYTN